ncbi:MAG: glycosyltransferase family 4 protein [Chitinophagaceae bacterium]
MAYSQYLMKRKIEDLIIFPFVLLGKIISKWVLNPDSFEVLFIFPFYHTGGAEKVHSLIANTFKNKKSLILFTRKSTDIRYLDAFKASGHQIIDISKYTDNKLFYWNNLVFRGVVASLVNRQTNTPIVFNGQSNFGYKLSPWISNSIKQIELIHAFCSFSWIRIPFISFYSNTIMISHHAIEEHKQQYSKLGIPEKEFLKIKYITNGIQIPSGLKRKERTSDSLKVLYVGRATTEKRVNLIGKIAKQLATKNPDIKFSMVGDVQNEIDSSLQPYIHFYGAINDEAALFKIYLEYDVLIMTSLHEGFPITIMEAMTAGCIILSTPVGDIPHHVKHGQNGFLFSSTEDESKIISESIMHLKHIHHDKILQQQIANNNQQYAQKEFELSIFEQRYQSLFDQLK